MKSMCQVGLNTETRPLLASAFGFSPAKYLIAGGAAAASFIAKAPDVWRTAGWATVVFFLLDIVTGTVASVRVKGQRITSKTFGRSLVKALCYLSVTVVAVVLDELARTRYAFSTGVVSLIAVREGLSVLENTRLLWESMGGKWPFDFLAQSLRDREAGRAADSGPQKPEGG